MCEGRHHVMLHQEGGSAPPTVVGTVNMGLQMHQKRHLGLLFILEPVTKTTPPLSD